MSRRTYLLTLLLVTVISLVGCKSTPPLGPTSTSATPSSVATSVSGDLIILHAGSLTVPVAKLGEAFARLYPDVTLKTEAGGSRTTARKVSELGREADLVISADYAVIDELLIPDWASWNIRFARNAMVIAYTDQSRYADEINSENWYQILTRGDVAYGHSDPDADPCGYRTLMVWQLAEKHYGQKGLADRLRELCPPSNIRPKAVELLALLQSGDMDYAFEYRSVAVQHNLRYVELPPEIDLSDPAHADFYRQAVVTLSGSAPGETITRYGQPIVYGVTIPKNAPNPKAAEAFVALMLSSEGQQILDALGQPPLVPPRCDQSAALPQALKEYVQ